MEQKKRRSLMHWERVKLYLMAYDILAINTAYFLALWIRFDCRFQVIPTTYLYSYLKFVPIYTVFSLVVFKGLRLYQSIWRFASYTELTRVTLASVVTGIFHATAITLLFARMPLTYYIFGFLIQFILIIGIRFSYRFVLLERGRRTNVENQPDVKGRVMLVGAGNAGRMILRDIKSAKETNDRVVCIIDDNPNKWTRFIDGVQVVGGRNDILENVEKYKVNKIYVAIPSASVEDKRAILNICKEAGCELKNMPGMYQFVTGEATVSALKEVAIEDLLERETIQVDMNEIFEQLTNRVLMVTGGGGSIGSELVRQLADHQPKQLIIFDVYENNAYDIQQEIKKKHPKLDLVVLIGSVRDTRRVMEVFTKYKPEIVFHAAAHKHVPLMEDSPNEAIKNNVVGTYKTAYAAVMNGCKRFVLISTDKAVNPTNIMGASKRLCEMVIQTFDRMVKEGTLEKLPLLFAHKEDEVGYASRYREFPKHPKTEFVAVRFGNVLGSNGSVIPLFKKQIAEGGPVTVTHPEIIRYFMTIPEAVSLVLQAATYAKGGEIFVLDMGEPVKIDTLARNLIKLSGYKPDVDIKVEYVGLRPGEKLFEEKLMAEEGMKTTPNHLIHIGCPIPFDTDLFLDQLEELMILCYRDTENIRDYVKQIVSTYHESGEEEHEECMQKIS